MEQARKFFEKVVGRPASPAEETGDVSLPVLLQLMDAKVQTQMYGNDDKRAERANVAPGSDDSTGGGPPKSAPAEPPPTDPAK